MVEFDTKRLRGEGVVRCWKYNLGLPISWRIFIRTWPEEKSPTSYPCQHLEEKTPGEMGHLCWECRVPSVFSPLLRFWALSCSLLVLTTLKPSHNWVLKKLDPNVCTSTSHFSICCLSSQVLGKSSFFWKIPSLCPLSWWAQQFPYTQLKFLRESQRYWKGFLGPYICQ